MAPPTSTAPKWVLKGSQRDPKWSQRDPKGVPKGTQMGPKGTQRTQKDGHESPKGAQVIFCKFGGPKREPKTTQMGAQNGSILGPIFLSFLNLIWSVLGGPNGSKLGSFDDARGNA